MNSIKDLPVIMLEFSTNSSRLGNLRTLCDSGSSLNCIRAATICCANEDVLPSLSNPIGVAGIPLDNKGDIMMRIQLPCGTYRVERFTLIENLCYDAIIGFPLLSSLGFALTPNDETVSLGQSMLPRVPEMRRVNGIQQALSDHTGAKFLCKSTDPLSLGDSVKTVKKCHQVLSIARPTEGQTTKATVSNRNTTQNEETLLRNRR